MKTKYILFLLILLFLFIVLCIFYKPSSTEKKANNSGISSTTALLFVLPPTAATVESASEETTTETEQNTTITIALKEPRYAASEEEIILAAKLAHFEDSTSRESMQAIVETVLNRVESGLFPDNVTDVIMQTNIIRGKKIYQFYTAHTEAFAAYAPTSDEYCAARAVFYDWVSLVNGALYFDAATAPPGRISKGLRCVATIGKTNFYVK